MHMHSCRSLSSLHTGTCDYPFDFDRQRNGVIAEVMRVTTCAEAKFCATAGALCLHVAIGADQRNAEARSVRVRRPDKASHIVSRATGIDPFGHAQIGGHWRG